MLVPDGSVGVQPLSGLPASARPTEAALPGALPSPEAGSVRRPRRPCAPSSKTGDDGILRLAPRAEFHAQQKE